ncbi:2-dehydropantoate 2-reductase [Xylophilus sp. Kf1]|nr:2-dehydropantoate 2-reductase [Xylophilus sp. Kf1]
MNITILGAGAMGSLFGGLLAESGRSVTLVDVDDAHLRAIAETGLRLQTDAGDRRVLSLQVCRPEQARAAADLLLVFTKTRHTAAALAGIGPVIGPHTRVLTLQNGLGNVETVSRFVPVQRLIVGTTDWPADRAGAGHVRSHGQGAVRLLAADGSAGAEVDAVAGLLDAAGLACTVDPQVWKSIWEKVAFNTALNSVCAVTGCSLGRLAATAPAMALVVSVIDEVVAVARAEGVAADAAQCRRNVVQALVVQAGHRPSMLQDVLAGRPTEVDALNGAVVDRARRHGLAVPHVETLLALVRLVEPAPVH